MLQDTLFELLRDLEHDRAQGNGTGDRLLAACVGLVEVTGAGIMLMSESEHQSTMGSSDAAMAVVEGLQFTLGEGPCIDSHRLGRPVLEPALAYPATTRWPSFTPPAVQAGVEAIFGFPLQVGAVRLGSLDVYLNRPGDLRDAQFSDALIMTQVITHELLALQADAAPGSLPAQLDHPGGLRSVVHQASGMVAVQLDIPIGDALIRIRAQAYASGMPVDEFARDVVQHRFRMETS